MTDEERRAEAFERMHNALSDSFERRQEYEERAAANRQQRLMNPATPPAATPASATQRARERRIEGRDWEAERKWVEAIIEQRLNARIPKLLDAIGAAMGQMANEEAKAGDGHLQKALDGLRKEFEGKIAECRLEYLENLQKIFAIADGLDKTAEALFAKADEIAELPSERRRRKPLPH